jgi:succinyl-CoA synthetase beta subunit
LSTREGTAVTETEGTGLLRALGIGRPAERLVRSAAEAHAAAALIGEPLVLKIQSPEVLHKTERGGVRVGVAASDAGRVFDELVAAFERDNVLGVLVQAMAAPGPELVVGLTNVEPGFPPLLTVGIGGVASELYRDAVTALAPVAEFEAETMIRSLKAAPLLTGHRGAPGSDLGAAARAVARISELGAVLGERLLELEINPLRLVDGGRAAVALDFLMQLGAPVTDTSPNPGGPTS